MKCAAGGINQLIYELHTDRYICTALVPRIQAQCSLVGCSVFLPDWTCAQPDGEEMNIVFPVP